MSHDRASEYWHGGQSHGFDPWCQECIEEKRKMSKAEKPGKADSRRIQVGQSPSTYDPFGTKSKASFPKFNTDSSMTDDFGFSAVSVEDVTATVEPTSKNVKNSMIIVFDKINPLLRKLEDNPEKDYIHWPNRAERIKRFREELMTLIEEEANTYGKE